MAGKLEVEKLSKEEIIYELKTRGVDEVALRNRRRLRFHLFLLHFKDEVKILEEKFVEVSSAVDTFSDTKYSSLYKKLSTKLTHLLGRVNRCLCATPEKEKQRTKLFGKFLTLQSNLQTKSEPIKRISSTLAISLAGDDESVTLSDISGSGDETKGDNTALNLVFRSVPLSKWNIKFNGTTKCSSINSFLERVEELRIARNATKTHLLRSAVDLF
ncbi:hypothetical protein FQA39_LY05348 [Lamprigera yunnana]|nr:hypothetical protein FQA39_LY05348 [Lamprigera yunnana]